MPNGVFNWTFDDVVRVLKENGFRLNHIRGSHFYFTGIYDAVLRQVCVPKHGKVALKPRTLKSIIIQSGLPDNMWKL